MECSARSFVSVVIRCGDRVCAPAVAPHLSRRHPGGRTTMCAHPSLTGTTASCTGAPPHPALVPPCRSCVRCTHAFREAFAVRQAGAQGAPAGRQHSRGLLAAARPGLAADGGGLTVCIDMAPPRTRGSSGLSPWKPWQNPACRQERLVAEQRAADAGAGWRRYFMPTAADRLVVGFRRWLDTRGGGGPTPGDPGPVETRREVLLDRLHQHTDNCPSCRQARTRRRARRRAASKVARCAGMVCRAVPRWVVDGRMLGVPHKAPALAQPGFACRTLTSCCTPASLAALLAPPVAARPAGGARAGAAALQAAADCGGGRAGGRRAAGRVRGGGGRAAGPVPAAAGAAARGGRGGGRVHPARRAYSALCLHKLCACGSALTSFCTAAVQSSRRPVASGGLAEL